MATQRQDLIQVQSAVHPACLAPRTLEEYERLAGIVANSSICPQGLKGRPGDVLVILITGSELGLHPTQALRTLGCINGMPFAYGDGQLALVKRHPKFIDIKEWLEGDTASNTLTAYCTMTREGQEPQTRSFSMEDAKKAGLWSKKGVWEQYPKRMLQHRARTYCCKDVFPDALFGLYSEDEAKNIPIATESVVTAENKGVQGLREVLSVQASAPKPEIEEAIYEVMDEPMDLIPNPIDDELFALILEKDVPLKSREKWMKQFSVNDIQDIPEDGKLKIIKHLKEKK